MSAKEDKKNTAGVIEARPATIKVDTNIPKAQPLQDLASAPTQQNHNQPPYSEKNFNSNKTIKAAPATVNVTTDIPKAQPLKDLAKTPVGNNNVYKQIHNAYDENLKSLAELTNTLQKEKEEKEANNKEAQKRERRRAMIAGIGDAVSSLANLIGVTRNASNQAPVSNYSKVANAAEKARQERKVDLENLNNRLTKLKDDAEKAKMAMNIGLAEYEKQWKAGKEAEARAEADRKLKEKQIDNTAIAAKEKAANDRIIAEARVEAERAKTGYWNRRGTESKDKVFPIAYNKDGLPKTLQIGKNTLYETAKINSSVLKDDIAALYGYKDWNDYIDSQSKNDRRYRKLGEAAKNDLRKLNLGFTDDEILTQVYQFGVRSPRFMALLESAAGGNPKADDNPLKGFTERPNDNSILNSLNDDE